MICAPAAERPASVGDQGRIAASDVRTAQMITTTTIANSESVRDSGQAQSPAAAASTQRLVERNVDLSARLASLQLPDHSTLHHCSRHSFPGIIRCMNSSKSGTVKAVSPWFGLQIMPFAIN